MYKKPTTRDELDLRLIDIIVEQLGVDKETVKPEARLAEDLGADSLDTVELVMAFEEEFEMEISDEDLEKFGEAAAVQTVGDYLAKRLSITA